MTSRSERIQRESQRCLLRPLTTDDLDWLADMVADRQSNGFLSEHTDSLDDARSTAEAIIFLDRERRQFGYWAIQDKHTGVIHGWTALGKLRPGIGTSDEIALSYALRRASWGQGFATEAAGHLVHYGFEVCHLTRIMAVIAAGNAASRRVLEKIGMRFVQSSRSAGAETLQYYRIDAPNAA